MIDCVSSSDSNFEKYILPWCEYFQVKNEKSEAVTISTSFSTCTGYKNPIDYLGKTDHALRCPAQELADTFIAQDKDVMQSNKEKRVLTITTYSDRELTLYLTRKQHVASHVICNFRKLNAGVLAQELYYAIKSIAPKHYSEINKCYEIVDSYTDLSARETQVMYYLMQGKSSTVIGNILRLSKRTIQHHVEHIKLKMFCNTTSQLVELGLYLNLNEMVPASLVY